MARSTTIIGEAQLNAILVAKAAAMQAATVAAVALEVKSVEADATAAAPRLDGDLQDGIKGTSSGTYGEVKSSARHGLFVEFGTSRTGAQPHMGPAADRSRSRFVGRVVSAVRRAVT